VDPEGIGFEAAGQVARLVATRLLVEGLPRAVLLNVNVPATAPKGVKLTRLGRRVYSEKVIEERDPRGRVHYWIGAGPPVWEKDEGSDMAAVHEGYASVTPLHLDLTHYGALRSMAGWESSLNAQFRKRAR
jgi:5'-nucleotidase